MPTLTKKELLPSPSFPTPGPGRVILPTMQALQGLNLMKKDQRWPALPGYFSKLSEKLMQLGKKCQLSVSGTPNESEKRFCREEGVKVYECGQTKTVGGAFS